MEVDYLMGKLLEMAWEEGIGGIWCPCAYMERASIDYALATDFYPDYSPHLDYDAARTDFVDAVRSHFAVDPTIHVEVDGFESVEAWRRWTSA